MAVMIPVEPFVTNSEAENNVFKWLRDGLDDDWTVLHSIRIRESSEIKDLIEIDFTIIGPPGVFCLEIKGGKIEQKNGLWIFIDRYGNRYPKKESPFRQANTAMYGLRKYLGNTMPIDGILIGNGVVTPDVSLAKSLYGIEPEAKPEMIYDEESILNKETMKEYVDRLTTYWQKILPPKKMLNKSYRETIKDKLRGNVIMQTSLPAKMGKAREEIIRLTKEQEQIVHGLASSDRAIIQGGAGTGKTFCALAEANRIASDGKNILFCCYNRRLANRLRNQNINNNISIMNIHRLMSEIIQESSIALPLARTNIDYDEIWPEVCGKAINELKKNGFYDAIIIDEGQDILKPALLINVIDPLLNGGINSGIWRLFMDQNQAIFDDEENNEITNDSLSLFNQTIHSSYTLSINCRNTRPISNYSSLISDADIKNVANIDGEPVNVIFYKNSKDQRKLISKEINSLISQGIKPNDITILSPVTLDKSSLSEGLLNSNYPLLSPESDIDLEDNQVGFYTIQSFKGLESDVVLLVDINNLSGGNSLGLNYVGTTRAKSLLSIFLDDKTKNLYSLFADNYAERIFT